MERGTNMPKGMFFMADIMGVFPKNHCGRVEAMELAERYAVLSDGGS